MPRNPYFPDFSSSEKELQEDLILESISQYGFDIYYLPRNIVKLDKILNEDIASTFSENYVVESYIESVDDYEGDGTLIAKFGLEVRNALRVAISKKRWDAMVTTGTRPREGDLVWFPLFSSLFEVSYVDGESPFFQYSNLPVWKLNLELFEYSNQSIDTDIDEINQFEDSHGNSVILSDLTFIEGSELKDREKITLITPMGIEGESHIIAKLSSDSYRIAVPKWNDSRPHSIVNNTMIYGEFGTEAILQSDAHQDMEHEQNSNFDNDIIDWSEDNPFGNI